MGDAVSMMFGTVFPSQHLKKTNTAKYSPKRKGQAQLLNCTYLALTTALLGRHENPERSLEHNVLQSSSVPLSQLSMRGI